MQRRSQSAARLEEEEETAARDALGNSRPTGTAEGTHTHLNTHNNRILTSNTLPQAHVCMCVPVGGSCSRLRCVCVCTCGGVLQQAQVCLSQAAAVLSR